MNNSRPIPLYLAAFQANNSPGETWGPRRRVNQTGVYAHLNSRTTNNNMSSEQRSSKRSSAVENRADTAIGTTNPTFNPSSIVINENENDLDENRRF